jgi:hypothetical protein
MVDMIASVDRDQSMCLLATSRPDHADDHRMIMRVIHRMTVTNHSIMRDIQKLARLIHLLTASNEALARDIQTLVDMITDRSCGTYKGWLA